MQFVRLTIHDLKEGSLRKAGVFIWIILIYLGSCTTFKKIVAVGLLNRHFYEPAVFIDYYLYATRGIGPYNITKSSVFVVPIYWFVFHILIAYNIGEYADKDIKHFGKYVMMKEGSRVLWWFSKCLWCIISVFLYYLIAFVTVILFCLVNNVKISFNATIDILSLFSRGLELNSNNEILLFGLILPFFISCAISLFQISVSLIAGSSFSYAGVCVMYILSAYYTTPFLLPNYTMWLRNNSVAIGSGIYTSIGIILSGFVSVASVTLGLGVILNKDIL